MTTIENIKAQLSWGTPETGIRTARGIRSLRKAAATPAFWQAWRNPETKAALQADGITCKPGQDGDWQVLWWADKHEDLPSAGANKATEARTTAVAEAAAKVFKGTGTVDPNYAGIKWSAEQLAVLNWFANEPGNLEVAALAGTGKTFTITHGLALAPEDDIVYLVFNKKNQREAKAKITDPRVDVRTLNSMGFRCVTSVWRGVQPDDGVEQSRVESVCRDIPSDALDAVLKLVGFAKNLFVGVPTAGQLAALCDDKDIFCATQDPDGNDEFPTARLADIALAAMKAALVRDPANRISFNDQVWLAVAQNWVRPMFDLVVVDETQDMNAPQLAMVQRLVRKGGRVCVVGDENQAIYGFRGAVQDGMGIMARALSAKILPLTVTHRCGKAIVAHAQQTVPDYKAHDDAPEGEVVRCDEAQMLEQAKVGDAILSRINAPLMGACLRLLKKGVPARIEGRDIGRQLLGTVRKLKAKSVPDFLKKLARWEEKQAARLKNTKNPEAKLATLADTRETLEAVAEGCANVAEVEARLLSLFQDSDSDEAKPAVVLSSVHKAKGLEWDRTFVLGWTFAKRKPKDDAEAREERNVYYVAVTRAKRTLALVSEGGQPEVKENADGSKEVAA